jgi:hypothetical protein
MPATEGTRLHCDQKLEFWEVPMEEPQRIAISREPDYGPLDAHPRLVVWLFICTVVAALLFIPLVLYFDVTEHGGLTIGVTVLVAGAGGGFVSSLRRLHCFEDIFPRREYVHLFRKLNFYVIAYSLIPPIVGAIGAIIIYLLFAGGVLTGDLFPEFLWTKGHTCTGLSWVCCLLGSSRCPSKCESDHLGVHRRVLRTIRARYPEPLG